MVWGQRSSRREFVKTSLAGVGLSLIERDAWRDAWLRAGSEGPADLEAAARLVRRRAVSPVHLTASCLRRIEALNPLLNAFISVRHDEAVQEARALDRELQRGQWRGPLHGIPVALKDNIDTAGLATTAASALYADRVPSED